MSIFDVLTLICGLSLFLFGMRIMGDSLKRSAGNRLKPMIEKLTSHPMIGFLFGFLVTSVIQSSAAVTVMVMGFVGAGTMTLAQSVCVVIGSNLGTAVTAWLTGLSGLDQSLSGLSSALRWATPSSWMPILALIGIILLTVSKKNQLKDIGTVFLGFAVLMIGMSTMSSSVSGLKESAEFTSALTFFSNPAAGVLGGTALAAIVQSSSSGIGILQSLSVSGGLTMTMTVPLIAGINIGSSVTPILSSIAANKNTKRVAFIYLFFNVFGSVVFIGGYALIDSLTGGLSSKEVDMWDIAILHSIFKSVTALILLPFSRPIAAVSRKILPDKKGSEPTNMLDERLLKTPAVAVAQAEKVTRIMAEKSVDAIKLAIGSVFAYDRKTADIIREYEEEVDVFEDSLGSYLVKLSSVQMQEEDSHTITKLLHLIGDFERISDHAVNVLESAEEIRDKQIVFSPSFIREYEIFSSAILEILDMTLRSFENNDLSLASLVEPLEQVVDDLKDKIKLNHILRVQKNECTIEHGFVLSDLLNNFERVSDHCSNIAGCVIEMGRAEDLNMHQYLGQIKSFDEEFNRRYEDFSKKYTLS